MFRTPASTWATGMFSFLAAIEHAKKRIFGIQFHPEVFHTERGVDMIRNFLLKVCGAQQDWTTKDYIAHAVADIRAKVDDKELTDSEVREVLKKMDGITAILP